MPEAHAKCCKDCVMAGALLDAIQCVLDDDEVSDFMLSHPIVRRVWDLQETVEQLLGTGRQQKF